MHLDEMRMPAGLLASKPAPRHHCSTGGGRVSELRPIGGSHLHLIAAAAAASGALRAGGFQSKPNNSWPATSCAH